MGRLQILDSSRSEQQTHLGAEPRLVNSGTGKRFCCRRGAASSRREGREGPTQGVWAEASLEELLTQECFRAVVKAVPDASQAGKGSWGRGGVKPR